MPVPAFRRLHRAALAGLLGLGAWAWAPFAASETITEVLQRSHAMKLEQLQRQQVDDARARQLQADFVRLKAQTGAPADVELRVIDGPVSAETLAGHVVVVSAALAVLPEGERLFILAHELGHATLGHWGEVDAVYRKHIPAEVRQELTDAVAPQLGREASALVHGHEYAADAYAWQVVRSLGYGMDSVMGALQVVPNAGDTATHPATRKRFARLRMLGESDLRSAARVQPN